MMIQAIARVSLLATLLTLFSHAHFLVNEYIITPRAATQIETMSKELTDKTGMHAYVIATKEKLGRGVNLYEYSKQYDTNMTKPYVLMIFAPNSSRLGLIPSSDDVKRMYDAGEVKDYAINILKSADSNSMQSKYDLAIVQSYSELADELAQSKGIKLDSTIKDESKVLIKILSYIVWAGLVLLIWIFVIRPRLHKER